MPRLCLAITDFALPLQADSAPRLATLERLLARGRCEPSAAPTWRHWLLEQANLAAPARLPLAGTVASHDGHFALVTPLHLLAGLEHVHLDPAGPPQLDATEWGTLVAGFNDTFGDSSLRLSHEHGAGLLSLPQALDVETFDPEPIAGRDAGAWLPRGPDGGWLRRLMTEAQMWLHEHPLNVARGARGQAPVNTLWLWGIGEGRFPLPSLSAPRLASNDAFLRRLWQRAGSTAGPTPDCLDVPSDGGVPELMTVSLGMLDDAAVPALEVLERAWLVPLEAALSDGRLERAEIFLAGSVVSLASSDRFRFWRRPRVWHEALR